MVTLRHYLQIGAGTALVVIGCQYLTKLDRPELVSSWLGPVMIVTGTALAGRASYRHRKSALLVGIALLAFAGLWAWNMHYLFDPSRVPSNFHIPTSFFFAPAVLILLGTFFGVFWRYLAPGDRTNSVARGTPEPSTKALPQETRWPTTAWYRLLLLACSAALALVVGLLAGVGDSERTQIIIMVLVLGCVASGLISEDTLSKIISRQKGP